MSEAVPAACRLQACVFERLRMRLKQPGNKKRAFEISDGEGRLVGLGCLVIESGKRLATEFRRRFTLGIGNDPLRSPCNPQVPWKPSPLLTKSLPPESNPPRNRSVLRRPKNCANCCAKSSLTIRTPLVGILHPVRRKSSRRNRLPRRNLGWRRLPVFYPSSSRGMWYRFDTRLTGVGLISENSIKFLTGLVK